MIELSFFAIGTPAPGGSKNAFVPRRKDGSYVTRPNGSLMVNVTDAGGEANKIWKNAVKIQARSFMRGAAPFDCALKVEFIFFLRRPQCHYRSGKLSHMLRDDAPQYHVQKPDALKYARGTEDACSGVIWKDDCQTFRVCSEKRWARSDEKTGCAIRIVVIESLAAEIQPTLI